ncbi:MAG: hypothetical protein NUV34_08590 [Sulfuricaulis sp.]|nr:hypothetical protein [Sulfuricaulis sp.]
MTKIKVDTGDILRFTGAWVVPEEYMAPDGASWAVHPGYLTTPPDAVELFIYRDDIQYMATIKHERLGDVPYSYNVRLYLRNGAEFRALNMPAARLGIEEMPEEQPWT